MGKKSGQLDLAGSWHDAVPATLCERERKRKGIKDTFDLIVSMMPEDAYILLRSGLELD